MKKTRLKNLKINESSLVDKGANQMAFITLFKRDTSEEKGVQNVLKGNSFLDTIKGNINNFWHGIRKNMEMAMTVDQTLEATNARDNWWKLTCAFEQSIISILQDETSDQAAMLTESVMQFINRAKQLAPYLQDMYKAEGCFAALEAISEDVTKAGKQISTANMERLKAAMKVLHELMGMDMEEYEAMYGNKKPKTEMQEKECKKPMSDMKKSDNDDKTIHKGDDSLMNYQDIIKSLTPDQQKAIQDEIAKQALEAINKSQPSDEIKKQLDEVSKMNVELVKALDAERDIRITKEFVAKAENYKGLPVKAEDFGKLLKEIHKKAPDQYEELIKTIDAANELIVKNNTLMKEIGGSEPPESDAMTKLNAKANEIKKLNPNMTFPVAFSKAMSENPDLYAEYRQQNK